MKGPDYKKKKENVNIKPDEKKMSNIPPEEGSNKKLNPDFGMINKQIVNDKGEVVGSKKVNPKMDPSAKDTPFKIQQKDVIKDTSMKNEVKPEVKNEVKPEVKSEVKPEVKKMHPIEMKNRARFGDDRVDMLKAKNIDFKAMRKGDMTKDDFIKKYPKSITAQKASGLRDEYEPYDLVLDYVLSEGHADTVEEAHYVMMQMDEDTIRTIIKEAPFGINKSTFDALNDPSFTGDPTSNFQNFKFKDEKNQKKYGDATKKLKIKVAPIINKMPDPKITTK